MPAEGNAPRAGTTAQELHRVLMGGNRMLHNTVGGVNGIEGATGTTEAPTAGHQQAAWRGGYGMFSVDRGRENIWDRSNNAVVLGKTTKITGRCRGGVNKVLHV